MVGVTFSSRRTECKYTAYIFRTRSYFTLLFTAEQYRTYHSCICYIQCTRTFKAVNFMAAYRNKVRTHFFRFHIYFTKRLHTVSMKMCIRCFFKHNFSYFFNRLNNACFIIDVHNAYKYRFIIKNVSKHIKVYSAFTVNVKILNIKSVNFKFSECLKYRGMFDFARNNFCTDFVTCRRNAENSQIICLGTARCKQNIFTFNAKHIGNIFFAFVYEFFSLNTQTVKRRRITETFRRLNHCINCRF